VRPSAPAGVEVRGTPWPGGIDSAIDEVGGT